MKDMKLTLFWGVRHAYEHLRVGAYNWSDDVDAWCTLDDSVRIRDDLVIGGQSVLMMRYLPLISWHKK